MRRSWRLWLASLAALVVIGVSAAEAGALSISSSPISFPAVILDGARQTVTGSTNAWRADATGESLGWNVTVSSTDFDSAGNAIPAANLELRLLDANIVVVSGDVNGPASTQTEFSALGLIPLKIASAAAGAGSGVYDLTPEARLTVPAETYAGSYSATVTVAINVGP